MPHDGLQVSIAFDRTPVALDSQRPLYCAVRLQAGPAPTTRERAPLQLVACIDVSGSMAGPKLERAKDSLRRLAEQLSPKDQLGLVAFESRVHRVFPPARMTPAAKEELFVAIERLHPMGNTNMSGGLRDALELARRFEDGPEASTRVRRVLLFTDGHANVGLHEGDLAGWQALVQESASRASVSWFGYGEDHDGAFLSQLADLTRGNSYRTASADAILDAFAKEIGGLLSIAAQDVQVRLTMRAGFGAPQLLNDAAVRAEGHALVVSLPDVFAEERRDIVLELPPAWPGDAAAGLSRRVVDVQVGWTDARTGRRDSVTLSGEVAFAAAGGDGAPDRALVGRIALLKAAQAQRRAAERSEQGHYEEARRVVQEAAALVEALGGEQSQALERLLLELADSYGDEGTYRRSRSALSSTRKGMGTQRPSGSLVDELFETSSQKEAMRRFRQKPGGE